MLIIDDILLFPVRGIRFVFQEIHNAAEQEVAQDAEAVRTELRELYMMLETGQISEEEFETREKELLDYLERIESPE